MITDADLKKLKANLKRGDRLEIAKAAGVSKVSVNNFFSKAKHDQLGDDTILKILKATSEVIKKNKKVQSEVEKIMKSI